MATHWSLRDVTEGWSKWQIALCVGAPIALGVAGVWYYKRKQYKSETADSGQNGAKTKAVEPETPQTPKDLAQAAKNKGNKYFKGGMFEQAIECYTEAINICPSQHKQDISTFYQNRAAAYENLKNYQQVVEDCTMALELNERYIKALTRRAKAFEALETFREALEDITTVCILEGFQNNNSLQLADRILKELGRHRARVANMNKPPSLPSRFFVRNYLAGFANDPVLKVQNIGKVEEEKKEEETEEGGEEKEAEALKESPPQEGQGDVGEKKEGEGKEEEEEGGGGEDSNSDENGDAVMVEKPSALDRAKHAYECGCYDEVISLCTEEIQTPDTKLMSEALLLRGTFYVLSGQGQLGLVDLDEILKSDSVSPRVASNALIKKGSIMMQRDQQKEAMDCFAHAELLDPHNSDIYHHRGQQELLMEKLEDAIADLQKSIILSPRFPTSYVQKAFAEHRRAMMLQSPLQRDQARKSFETAIREFPQCSDAYMLYGQSLCDLGLYEDADKQFAKALQLEPDNANTIVHRGLLMLQWKADAEKAVKIISSALEVDSMCEYAYEILGTIRVQQGDMKVAVEMFERAIKLSKSESEMAHLYSLLDAAQVQMKVAQKLGIPIPLGGAGPV